MDFSLTPEHEMTRCIVRESAIYEGTNQVHELIQAAYALGYREDRSLRCELPPYEE